MILLCANAWWNNVESNLFFPVYSGTFFRVFVSAFIFDSWKSFLSFFLSFLWCLKRLQKCCGENTSPKPFRVHFNQWRISDVGFLRHVCRLQSVFLLKMCSLYFLSILTTFVLMLDVHQIGISCQILKRSFTQINRMISFFFFKKAELGGESAGMSSDGYTL